MQSTLYNALAFYTHKKPFPLLVENLTYGPSRGPGTHIGRAGELGLANSMPCVHALGMIGSPCFDELIAKVCKNYNDKTIMAAAIVFHVAMNDDDAIALLRARAAATDDQHKAKVLREIIRNIDEKQRSAKY